MTNFSDMGLSDSTLAALEKKGFETASPIQAACIPLLLAGDKDIIGQAQTGTGKTAAFAIPLIEKIDPKSKQVQAVVITPTRELAIQVAEEIASLRGSKKLSVALVYGGASIGQQMSRLRQGAHIVVGTPGRMIDLINRRKLNLSNISYCVLDEADEMLNMGFLEDIELILDACNKERQMLCFSATMPPAIKRVAERYMGDYELIKVASKQLTVATTQQIYFEVYERDKLEALTRIMDSEKEFYAIIFCRTRRQCDEISSHLQNRGYLADALHGDMDQKKRERILNKFKKKHINLLIATDVAARGIDVDNLTHVVNYHMPQDPESYTHRIGRTGRAGNQGIAITFVTPKEFRTLVLIQRRTKADIQKQQIPTIESIIAQKKTSLLAQVEDTMKEDLSRYESMLEKLRGLGNDEELLLALCKIAFSDQIEVPHYSKIQEVRRNPVERTGKTRLFIARGRSHGYTGPRELIARLVEETDIAAKDIHDVSVLEDFSFVTCPFAEAELILDVFKRKPGRSLVSKSKDKKSGGGGRRRGGDRRGGGKGRSYQGNRSDQRGDRKRSRSRRERS